VDSRSLLKIHPYSQYGRSHLGKSPDTENHLDVCQSLAVVCVRICMSRKMPKSDLHTAPLFFFRRKSIWNFWRSFMSLNDGYTTSGIGFYSSPLTATDTAHQNCIPSSVTVVWRTHVELEQ